MTAAALRAPEAPSARAGAAAAEAPAEQVQGKVLAPVPQPSPEPVTIRLLLGLGGIILLICLGIFLQIRANRARPTGGSA